MRPFWSSPQDSISRATLSPSAIEPFTVILSPSFNWPTMLWKRRPMYFLSWTPAAGDDSGLPAIHHVTSSLIMSSAPGMSFALKRPKKSDASFLVCSMVMDESPVLCTIPSSSPGEPPPWTALQDRLPGLGSGWPASRPLLLHRFLRDLGPANRPPPGPPLPDPQRLRL